MNIDVCVNSLLPEGKKILFVDNGAYTSRGVEVAQYYHLPYIDMKFAFDERPDLAKVEEALRSDPDIAVVYTTHNETGTGILNPIKDIGEIAHRYGCTFVVDTTSTYAMIPIDMDRDNIDFVMASAQKGLITLMDNDITIDVPTHVFSEYGIKIGGHIKIKFDDGKMIYYNTDKDRPAEEKTPEAV